MVRPSMTVCRILCRGFFPCMTRYWHVVHVANLAGPCCFATFCMCCGCCTCVTKCVCFLNFACAHYLTSHDIMHSVLIRTSHRIVHMRYCRQCQIVLQQSLAPVIVLLLRICCLRKEHVYHGTNVVSHCLLTLRTLCLPWFYHLVT